MWQTYVAYLNTRVGNQIDSGISAEQVPAGTLSETENEILFELDKRATEPYWLYESRTSGIA